MPTVGVRGEKPVSERTSGRKPPELAKTPRIPGKPGNVFPGDSYST